MSKMKVAYSDVFDHLEAVIKEQDENEPVLSRAYNNSKTIINRFKLNQHDENDQDYNQFIEESKHKLKKQEEEEKQQKEQEARDRKLKQQKERDQEIAYQRQQEEKKRAEKLRQKEERDKEYERQQQERIRQEKERRRKEQEKQRQREEKEQREKAHKHLKIQQEKRNILKTNGTKDLENRFKHNNQQSYHNNENNQQIYTFTKDNKMSKEMIVKDEHNQVIMTRKFNNDEKLNLDLLELSKKYQLKHIQTQFEQDRFIIYVDVSQSKNSQENLDKDYIRVIHYEDENGRKIYPSFVQKARVVNNDYLMFDEIKQLPYINGYQKNDEKVKSLYMKMSDYKYEINELMTYHNVLQIIYKQKDVNVNIYNSRQELIRTYNNVQIKQPLVYHMTKKDYYSINITDQDQFIFNQIKYLINDNKMQYIDLNIEKSEINLYLEEELQQDVNNDEEQVPQSKYKPLKQEFIDAFNKVELPKAYDIQYYNQFEMINVRNYQDDINYYQEIMHRYLDRFLEHVNVVRKELKIKKMQPMQLDDDALVNLVKLNTEFIENDQDENEISHAIHQYCSQHFNHTHSSMYDVLPIKKKAMKSAGITPEYLADRDFADIRNRLLSYKEHRQMASDKEINHLIRNKYLVTCSLYIRLIESRNNNAKHICHYSSIKIYSE